MIFSVMDYFQTGRGEFIVSLRKVLKWYAPLSRQNKAVFWKLLLGFLVPASTSCQVYQLDESQVPSFGGSKLNHRI